MSAAAAHLAALDALGFARTNLPTGELDHGKHHCHRADSRVGSSYFQPMRLKREKAAMKEKNTHI